MYRRAVDGLRRSGREVRRRLEVRRYHRCVSEPDDHRAALPDESATRRIEDDLALAEAAMAHVEAGDLDAAEAALSRLDVDDRIDPAIGGSTPDDSAATEIS